jgi:hypothetical protein
MYFFDPLDRPPLTCEREPDLLGVTAQVYRPIQRDGQPATGALPSRILICPRVLNFWRSRKLRAWEDTRLVLSKTWWPKVKFWHHPINPGPPIGKSVPVMCRIETDVKV